MTSNNEKHEMVQLRYGLREMALKSRQECTDSCRIDVLEKLGRFVTIETCTCSVTTCFAMLQGFSLSLAFEKHSGLTTDDVFTQIAKDVVGQGLDHGTLTFKAKFARVIRANMADSRRKRFSALGRRSPRGLLHNQRGVSGGMTAFSDVTEGKERQKPASRRAKK
ncbi:hypothetical protein F2Q68_00022023 [Brassica cretica]|uniref:Uncharacterized protein n=1 Tax=Brassica cretica TaxID=69181 RepID=A0A8S9G217_BRACR|nr:hypothetical protein F2Q68_00022023 [Brassica cretica]